MITRSILFAAVTICVACVDDAVVDEAHPEIAITTIDYGDSTAVSQMTPDGNAQTELRSIDGALLGQATWTQETSELRLTVSGTEHVSLMDGMSLHVEMISDLLVDLARTGGVTPAPIFGRLCWLNCCMWYPGECHSTCILGCFPAY